MKTEEDVKVKFLLPYLKSLGYLESTMSFEKAVEVQEGRKKKTIFADIVIYASEKNDTPLILCETKAPTEVLDKNVREQAISYARLLPKIAPITLLTNGNEIKFFDTLSKNPISELPNKKDFKKNLPQKQISKAIEEALREEAKHELFIIDDVQSFKSILRACHNRIRNNEGYDPAQAFDEMSKLLFCKMYEEKTNSKSNRFRLYDFDQAVEKYNINIIQQIYDEAKKNPEYGDLLAQDSTIDLKHNTIKAIVKLFEDYDLSLTAFDIKGEAFEFFLGDTFTGGLGEYFTPRNVVEFMVDAVSPKIGDKIIDPFCGTGGFLIYSFDTVNEKIVNSEFDVEQKKSWKKNLAEKSLYGTDWKERTSLACKMNMMIHGDGHAGIFMHHGLIDVPGQIENGMFNVCITNPPFGSLEGDSEILSKYALGLNRKSQDRVVLGLERAVNLVKPGGQIAIIVIDGILDNSSSKYIRDYIRSSCIIRGVVSLPKSTFEGYNARSQTSILFLNKRDPVKNNSQGDIFMAIADNSGYLSNGDPTPGNQLPSILIDYKNYLNGEKDNFIHPRSWTADVLDRLDASYYEPIAAVRSQRVEEYVDDLSEELSGIRSKYKSFQDSIVKLFETVEFESVKLSDIIVETKSSEKVLSEKLYRLLGVKWWGEGVFLREEKLGKDIKGKTLYKINNNVMIYNRLFAFRGSFAVVKNLEEGHYVSNEFPTFKLVDETRPTEILEYISYCLTSPNYLKIVDKLSTGSTKVSRNRLSQKLLLDMNINIPKRDEDLLEIVNRMRQAAILRASNIKVVEKMKKVTGELLSLIPTS